MQELIDSYYYWLKENTILSQVGEYTEVTSPFIDRHNDCIQFYMKKIDENNVFITDDGYTLNDLESCGFTFNSPKRKELLNNILLNYHLTLDKDNCITVSTSIKNFPFRKHFFIQGIIAINDLYSTNKNNISSLFAEDFAEFLDSNDIYYTENLKLTGVSGFDHNIDYVLPGLKRKNIPERYLKVINNPSKTNTEIALFIWNDIKETRRQDKNMIVILNDVDNNVKPDTISALENYNITPLKWSDKKNILSHLKQVG